MQYGTKPMKCLGKTLKHVHGLYAGNPKTFMREMKENLNKLGDTLFMD